jgi:predicted dienelactone hydrolase
VKAVLVMSPQGPSTTFGLTTESWKDVTVPTLFMTGTLDRGVSDDETPEWRRQAFELSPAGDKWLVVFEGARHLSFTGRNDTSAEPPRPTGPILGDNRTNTVNAPGPARESMAGMRFRGTFTNVKAISLAFFDTYLKSDAAGRTALEGAAGRGGVELVKK